MTKVNDVYKFIDSIAPFNTQMDFDNSGLLVGRGESNITSAILSLDITKEVVLEAVKEGANLIISHHPVIFNPMKSLMQDSIPYLLAKNDISAICAHTNLDMAQEIGVNANLGRKLKLENIEVISYCNGCPLLLKGDLQSIQTPNEFTLFIKKALKCNGIRYTEGQSNIKKVAFCCGGAGDMIFEAIESNVDAFISGDIKHHEMLAAKHYGITAIDAGHFSTEDVVIQPLVEILNNQFKDVTFTKSTVNHDIVTYL